MEIRKGTSKDLSAVLDLVIELAIYEKEPDAVTTTLEDYQKNFESKVFDILVAEQDGKVVGVMLYFIIFSTWKGRMLYLEDFVVSEKVRGTGIGQKLFDALVKEAKALECVLMKWQVLEWNDPAINFYKKYEVEFDKEWWNCKLYV